MSAPAAYVRQPVIPGVPREPFAKSPSQIDAFRTCERKWGWKTLEGIDGQNKSAALGEACHAVQEDWLRDGKPLPNTEEGRIMMAGIHLLPPPGVAEVERKFRFETPTAKYTGKVDFGYWDKASGLWVVGDHKTTSGLGWAKTPDDLREDPQAMIYAHEAMLRHGVPEVELFWLYYQTKGAARSKPVKLRVLRDHVLEQFAKLEETAAIMCEHERKGARALDLKPTASACSAFGGCAYIDRCNLSPAEAMRSIMSQQSLRERMEARNAAKNGSTPPAATKPTPPPAAATKPTPPPAAPASKPAGALPMHNRKPGGLNPPEQPRVAAVPQAGEVIPEQLFRGSCACGAVVFLEAGKVAEHKRKGGVRCPGSGKAPLPDTTEEVVDEGVPGATAEELHPAAAEPPPHTDADAPPEELAEEPEPVEVVRFEEKAPEPEKVTPITTRRPLDRKPAAQKTETPPAASSSPAELTLEAEDRLVLALLEEAEPGIIRQARASVRRLHALITR